MLNHIELLFKPHLRSQNIIERIIEGYSYSRWNFIKLF